MDLTFQTLRLLSAVIVDDTSASHDHDREAFLKEGLFVHPAIPPRQDILSAIRSVFGQPTPQQANHTFWRRWHDIASRSEQALKIHAVIHYLSVWIKDHCPDTIAYVPAAGLDMPDITTDIPVRIIRAVTEAQALTETVRIATAGTALSEQHVADSVDVLDALTPQDQRKHIIGKVNRDVRAALSDRWDIAPDRADDFMRYAVKKLTGRSLLIKDDETIKALAMAQPGQVDRIMAMAPPDMAQAFFRYKPLLLAMRKAATDKKPFNALRKKANHHHQPLSPHFLDTVVQQLRTGSLNMGRLEKEVARASTARLIRLANAIKLYIHSDENLLFPIRNGKVWAAQSNKTIPETQRPTALQACQLVINAIAEHINTHGKPVVIPPYVDYAVPASDKQTHNGIPFNTIITFPKNRAAIGVHWTNLDNERLDLDLALITIDGAKAGWDGNYKSNDLSIMHSGDMTDAPPPDGAAEWIALNAKHKDLIARITVSRFHPATTSHEVPFTLMAARDFSLHRTSKSIVNPKDIFFALNMTMNGKREQTVAFIHADKNRKIALIITGGALSKGRTSTAAPHTLWATRAAINKAQFSLRLHELLQAANIPILSSPPPNNDECITLNPQNINADTIPNLINLNGK